MANVTSVESTTVTAQRVVAVVARGPSSDLDDSLADAMLEDVVDLVVATPQVTGVILAPPGRGGAAERAAWPGMPVIDVPARDSLAASLAVVPSTDCVAVAVVAADVPQLPGLLLGKLFRAVAGNRGPAIAVIPAADGGVVAIAARLPVVSWLAQVEIGLDDAGAYAALREAAPRGGLATTPGWHRIRRHDDLRRLDAGHEGGDATLAARER